MTGRATGTERVLLTRAVVLTAAVGALAAALGLALRGAGGLAGGLAGAGLVLAFLLVGQLPVAQVARGRRRLGSFLLVALFVARVMILVVAYAAVVSGGGSPDRDVLGVTVIACALAWTAGTVWSALRWRPYVVEPDDPDDPHRWGATGRGAGRLG